jgi:hypothetical protein
MVPALQRFYKSVAVIVWRMMTVLAAVPALPSTLSAVPAAAAVGVLCATVVVEIVVACRQYCCRAGP